MLKKLKIAGIIIAAVVGLAMAAIAVRPLLIEAHKKSIIEKELMESEGDYDHYFPRISADGLSRYSKLKPEKEIPPPITETEEETYYITKYGERYHKKNCYYITHKQYEITLKYAEEHGYTPCAVCMK